MLFGKDRKMNQFNPLGRRMSLGIRDGSAKRPAPVTKATTTATGMDSLFTTYPVDDVHQALQSKA